MDERVRNWRTQWILRHEEANKNRKNKRVFHVAKQKHRKYFKDFIKEDLIKAVYHPKRFSFFEYELDD